MKYLFFPFFFLIVLHSSAQQYSWEKLNTDPYRGKQDDICFVDGFKGWYINGYGRIYHTTDGGNTWTMQLEKKGTFFRCIGFIDSLTGFAGTVGTEYFQMSPTPFLCTKLPTAAEHGVLFLIPGNM